MNLRNLYPVIKPNEEVWMKAGHGHSIYTASYGNTLGIPVVVVHGGPGSGSIPDFARFFNPEKYHIILIDQRGAGKSTPKGEMRDNTTQDLIADMEMVRKHYHIKDWVVYGGSWGSTLALLYAQAHPRQVTGLILRGIFLGRAHDVSAFTRDDGPAALLHHNEWQEFKRRTTEYIKMANLKLSVDKDPIYSIYYHLMTCGNDALKKQAASTLAGWEKFNSSLIANPDELNPKEDADKMNTALTEATYFEHDCFIEDNQILRDVPRLKNIPVYIVQGSYDLVCPPYMADELEGALRAVNKDKNLVVRYNCVAGHTYRDEQIRDALIRSTDEMAERLDSEIRPQARMR